MRHPVNRRHDGDGRTTGERWADSVTGMMGSWRFIGYQTLIVALWVIGNVYLLGHHPFDKYPFILLNLLFSTQAAYASPLILLSGNRQAAKDRDTLEHAAKVEDANQAVLTEMMAQNLRMEQTALAILQRLDAAK